MHAVAAPYVVYIPKMFTLYSRPCSAQNAIYLLPPWLHNIWKKVCRGGVGDTGVREGDFTFVLWRADLYTDRLQLQHVAAAVGLQSWVNLIIFLLTWALGSWDVWRGFCDLDSVLCCVVFCHGRRWCFHDGWALLRAAISLFWPRLG